MVNVIVRHRVEDYPRWKKAFDDFEPERRSGGEKSYRLSSLQDEPNNICLFFEWDSIANARTFMESPKLAETMKQAGVSEEPQIYFTEELDRGTFQG